LPREVAMDVTDWLRQLGLERYAATFRENEVDAAILPRLTAQDLLELGVIAVGHRRKLLDAIAALPNAIRPDRDSSTGSTTDPGDRDGRIGSGGERRHITVLFCDMIGSTPLSTHLDPEDLRQLLSAYRASAGTAIAQKRGYVAQFVGDGIMAYFGWPNPDEAHAESAVRAALAVIEAMRAHLIAVRIGIATGLVVVGDLVRTGTGREFTAVGETPNLASRLQERAGPNTVVVSDATRLLLGRLFEMQDDGLASLKGFDQPQRIWRVTRETGFASRSEALYSERQLPLIGRETELDLLLRHWQRVKTGEGHCILLSGEPGIGKSRLLAALEHRIADEPHVALRYFCSPHLRDSALHPIIARWEQEAGFTHIDSAAARQQKLAALDVVAALAAEDMALLATLLSIPMDGADGSAGMSGQQRKEKILTMLVRLIAAQAATKPVLLTLEDAHWADPSSLELLELAMEQLAALPVLLIISFRPEFVTPWIGRPGVSLIALSRLNARQSALLAMQVAAARMLDTAILERIVTKTDGVPLFIEELTKHLLDSPLQRDPALQRVPETLHASLLARLDSMPAGKQVAQIAAAIGRDFSYSLLSMVARLSGAVLSRGLDELIASGLVFRRREAANETYTFKHALICDAAYDSMLRSRRSELHAAIVDALESDTTFESWPSEVLGYHCARAGQLEKAAQHYRKAASSPQRFAEMQSLLERALEADPTSVTSLTMLANVLMNRTHMFGLPINNEEVSRAGELIARARALRPDSTDVLASHASWLRARFRFAEAYPVLKRLAAIEPERSATHLMLGVCNAEMNRLEDALADFSEALRLDPADPDLWLRHWRIGETLGLLGRDSEAIPWFQRALLANPNNSLSNRSRIRLALASAFAWVGEMDQARALVAEANAIWPFHTVRGWRAALRRTGIMPKIEHVQEGLRRAGLRDHVAEDVDFGASAGHSMPRELIGHTPTGVPGAATISTAGLKLMIAEEQPMILDVMASLALDDYGQSIPNAIALPGAGAGGSFADAMQTRLERKLRQLLGTERNRPLVTLAWNAERWSARNLALRLVALGYTQVHWYRGGREVWRAQDLPTADLTGQDW
jgi:class 3 adenylate cyclase/tetratricopeptide (TPR) repeat protein/rhodanese-related sulfurtransferase